MDGCACLPEFCQFWLAVGAAVVVVVIVEVVGCYLLSSSDPRHRPADEPEVVLRVAKRVGAAAVVQNRHHRKQASDVSVLHDQLVTFINTSLSFLIRVLADDVGVGVEHSDDVANLFFRELAQFALIPDKVHNAVLPLGQAALLQVVHQHVQLSPGFTNNIVSNSRREMTELTVGFVLLEPEDPEHHDGVVAWTGLVPVLDVEAGAVLGQQLTLPGVVALLPQLAVRTAQRPGAMPTPVDQERETLVAVQTDWLQAESLISNKCRSVQELRALACFSGTFDFDIIKIKGLKLEFYLKHLILNISLRRFGLVV